MKLLLKKTLVLPAIWATEYIYDSRDDGFFNIQLAAGDIDIPHID